MSIWSLLAWAAVYAAAAAQSPIVVRYPEEGAKVETRAGVRVMGSVADPKAVLKIAGKAVPVHRSGGFLAWVPVSTGTFQILIAAELPSGSTSLTRTITVPGRPEPLPSWPGRIAVDGLEPGSDLELPAGEWLNVAFRGSPGHRAEFQLPGGRSRLPMVETAPGLYQGSIVVQSDDFPAPGPVRFHLKEAGGAAVSALSHGKVGLSGRVWGVAEVRSEEPINVRAGPSGAFLFFPVAGTRFVIGSRRGGMVELRLSDHLRAWTGAAGLDMLAEGTPPPRAALHTLRTEARGDATTLHLGLSERVPFIVDSDAAGGLSVRLFYTTADTDWIIYDSSDTFVREVGWRQVENQEALVTARLEPGRRHWGWHAEWEPGGLKIELRHPPRLPEKGSVLRGRVVIVDPGHGPAAPGAMGPTGVLEKDVNLAIARQLRELLQQEGAEAVMTRDGDVEVGLLDRAKLAREKRGEVFLSLHNNNLPENINPFARPHGLSVFYYHPHSLELGRAVHRGLLRSIGLPDEGLRYGNLYVARISAMPAALVESAYMTFPEQEALLVSHRFQRKVATAALEGLRDFLEAERQRQRRESRAPAIARPAPESDLSDFPASARTARAPAKPKAPASARGRIGAPKKPGPAGRGRMRSRR